MSGRDVLNADQHGPMQLPMFMRATDLRDSLTGTIDKSTSDVDEVMESKLTASKGRAGHGHGTGVHADVAKHGVLNPVQMVHGVGGDLVMGQGHHRTAAAADISHTTGRDMWIPVVHTDARESSESPLDVTLYGDPGPKRDAIMDYARWSQNTKAFGQDRGWAQHQEDAWAADYNKRKRTPDPGAPGAGRDL